MTTPSVTELQKNLSLVYQKVTDELSDINFNKTHQQLFVVVLCCRIIEIAYVCLQLIDKKGSMAVLPGIVRQLLEVYADLINLIDDPNYLYQLELSFYEQQIKLARICRNEGQENPYLLEAYEKVDLEKRVNEVEEEIEKCKAKGAREKFNIEGKFRKAGLLYEYHSIYRMLCLHTHNNLNELEKRHIRITGKRLSISILENTHPKELYKLVEIIGSCLVNTLKRVCALMDREPSEAAEKALENLRRLYNSRQIEQ